MSGVKASASDTKIGADAAPNSPLSPPVTPIGVTRPESGLRAPEYLSGTVSAISAVVFSSPAFLTPNLAEAFLQDRLLINTIYDRDIIPRFSFKTIQLIAEELKDPDFCAQADIWTQEDKTDFSAYAASMGKASDIHKTAAAASGATAEDIDMVDADIAVPVAEALAMHDGAVNSAPSSNAPPAGVDMSLQPPAKPAKPAKPEKIKSVSSIESCASYCTADGDDTPLSPASRAPAESTHAAHGTGAGIAAANPSPATAAASAPTAPPAQASAPAPALGSFMQSMSAWHALATNVIDKLQNVNDNVGGTSFAARTEHYLLTLHHRAQ
jgi:hypothetical protein